MAFRGLVNKIETAILLAGLLSIGVVAYSLLLMSNTVQQLMPLIQITNDLKVRVSSAHLWFEEAMEGDLTIDVERDVLQNIDEALVLVQQQSEKMQQIDQELYRKSMSRLDQLENGLQALRKQTRTRWQERAISAPGSKSDQIYDASFHNILRLCDENRRTMTAFVGNRQKMLTRMNTAFILFLVIVFSGITYAAVRYRHTMEKKNETVMKLSQAIEQTDDLVAITNREGVLEYVNPAFENKTGYKSEEAVGRRSSILKSGTHSQEFYEHLWQTILSGKVFRSEIVNRKKNGELYVEEKTISPIRNAEGNITHYVSTAKDITERKRMEKELLHSRDMKIIGQLASGVAHEVRNPLNAIQAVSEAMFQDFSDQAEYAEYLSHIRTQVKRLSELMRDLLELGRPIPASTMQTTGLITLCEASMKLWKQYQPELKHSIRLLAPASQIHPEVKVNQGKLQQVFVNLLDNAAQNSPEGSEIRLVVHEPQDGQVRISVEDQGPGIANENPDQLFEPFFTTRQSGTGLGLSIVKQIVERHGGRISLKNIDPPPGCAVDIILPLANRQNA